MLKDRPPTSSLNIFACVPLSVIASLPKASAAISSTYTGILYISYLSLTPTSLYLPFVQTVIACFGFILSTFNFPPYAHTYAHIFLHQILNTRYQRPLAFTPTSKKSFIFMSNILKIGNNNNIRPIIYLAEILKHYYSYY